MQKLQREHRKTHISGKKAAFRVSSHISEDASTTETSQNDLILTGWVVRDLLRHKAHAVGRTQRNWTFRNSLLDEKQGLSRVNARRAEHSSCPVWNSDKHSHHMWGWLGFTGKIPVAVEDLPQDGVVRFLRHRTFPPRMESWKVPLHHLNHALPRLQLVCNTGGRRDKIHLSIFFVWTFECLTVAQMRLPHK